MAALGVVTGISMAKGLMGIITLFLVVMYLMNLTSHGVEAKKVVEQIEEELELERELKILNVPPLKTIRTKEGDVLDCVDFYKQPSLSHPLLRDHKIQMKPTFFPKGDINKTSSATEPMQIISKHKKCPKGTIPIRRTSKGDLLRARALSREFITNVRQINRHFPGQYIADVNMELTNGPIRGASASINVYNPTVSDSQFTTGQIWINGGPNETPNYIMVGWTVNPILYGDHNTRLFTFWTGHNYKDGCFDTRCKGFVQVDRLVTPGVPISPVSTVDGKQYVINVNINQDPKVGHWLLTVNDIYVGYWPKELFSYLGDGAKSVSWGGLTQADSNGVSHPMGSGRFPSESFACYFDWLKLLDKDYKKIKAFEMSERVDSKNCYGITTRSDESPDLKTVIFFGGPGGACG